MNMSRNRIMPTFKMPGNVKARVLTSITGPIDCRCSASIKYTNLGILSSRTTPGAMR